MKRAPVPDAELRRAKDHLKGSLMLSLENTASRMSHLARQEIYFDRHFGLDETLAGVERVTAADVQRVAQRFVLERLACRDRARAVGAVDRSRAYRSWIRRDDSPLHPPGDGRDLERPAPLRDLARGRARRRRCDGRRRPHTRARPPASFAPGRPSTSTRIDEIEQVTQHDVIAFTTAVAEKVGPAARWLHFGLTSSDVRRHRPGAPDARGLRSDRQEHRRTDGGRAQRAPTSTARTPMIGRTHGVHAEPMTFGLKLALWYAELQRDLDRVLRARDVVVGRQDFRRGRDLRASRSRDRGSASASGSASQPAPVSSQVIQRDRHAELMSALAITARVAREVRARNPRPAEDRNR